MHVQHVIAANIDLEKPSFSIKILKTCNQRETVHKGEMKLPDHLHKGLLYGIILGGEIDFNDYDKDGQQDE